MVESGYVVVNASLAYFAVPVQDVIEEGTDVNSIVSFFVIFEFRVIDQFDGFGHMFYANELDVLVFLPVDLVFYDFGAHVIVVGCTCAVLNIGVHEWLLRGRIIWSSVLRSECCGVFWESQLDLVLSQWIIDGY